MKLPLTPQPHERLSRLLYYGNIPTDPLLAVEPAVFERLLAQHNNFQKPPQYTIRLTSTTLLLLRLVVRKYVLAYLKEKSRDVMTDSFVQWCNHTPFLEKNFLRMCCLFVENFDEIKLTEEQLRDLENARYLKGDGPSDHRKRQNMPPQRRAYKLVKEFLRHAKRAGLTGAAGNVSL